MTRRSRRWIIGGAGAVAAGAAGTSIYRISPSFWRQYAGDLSRPIATPRFEPAPGAWPDTGLHAAWLGHSTVLLKMDGFTILTDPVFSRRAGIDIWVTTIGVKRLIQPPIDLDGMPKIDLVVLSHAHMDHFDLPTLRALESQGTQVVTASKTSDLLRVDRYANVQEVAWGEEVQAGPVRVKGVEVNHWGARIRSDTWRGYNGYLLSSGRWKVLFAGDTADTDSFKSLKTLAGVDLAIMPIGAYNPWIRYHCNPEQAWRMGNHANAQFFIPVHHRTFPLGREGPNEPIERFMAAARSTPDRVVVHDIGQEFHLS